MERKRKREGREGERGRKRWSEIDRVKYTNKEAGH